MKRPNKAKLLFLAVAAVWLVAAIALGGWWLARGPTVADHVDLGGPGEAVSSFAMCLRAGHRGDVLACVVGEVEQQRLAAGFGDAVAAGLDADDLTQLPLLDVTDATVSIDGDRATVTPAGDADDRPAEFVVVQDGGRWRVDLLQTLGLSAGQADELATRLRSAADALEQTPLP